MLRRASLTSERTALGMLAAIAALITLALARRSFLPFVDLPQHLALARILVHLDDPAVAALFEKHLFPQVNILYLLLTSALLEVLSDLVVAKITVALYVAALATGLLLVTRALGTSAWGAVLGLLFAVHFNLMFGLMSYCLAIPIMLAILALIATGNAPWRSVRGVTLCALWTLLALGHILVFIFTLGAAALWIGLGGAAWQKRLQVLVPPIPALLLIGAWLAATFGGAPVPGASGRFEAYFHDIPTRLGAVGWALNVISREARVEWMMIVAVAAIATWLLVMERRRSRTDKHVWLRSCALAAAVLFAALPVDIYDAAKPTYGLFLIYQRFLVFVPLLLLPSLTWPGPGRRRQWLVAATLALAVVNVWNVDRIAARAARNAEGLDAAIAALPPDKILKSLIYTPFPDGVSFRTFLHAGSYYQARQFGEVDHSFALLPMSPVRYKDPARAYLSRQDEHLYPDGFDWRSVMRYDYVLIYDRHGEWSRYYADVPLPVRFEHNDWRLLDVESVRRTR